MANLLQNLEIIGTGDKIIKEILLGRSIEEDGDKARQQRELHYARGNFGPSEGREIFDFVLHPVFD